MDAYLAQPTAGGLAVKGKGEHGGAREGDTQSSPHLAQAAGPTARRRQLP